jgi:serine/threonine-protein kinase
MATIHIGRLLAEVGSFSHTVAIKRLLPQFSKDREFREMFLEEARLAARINHPNVVQTNEVGMDGNNLFIAMEYLEGQSLEELVRRAAKVGKPLSLKYYLPILVDTLRGLHFAHELKDFQGHALKVIHRDVSPHNIFVTYDGQVKVVDFGIAKAADSSHETRTGVLKGKVAYMAPEQIGAKERVDRRADLFAVGAIMWRALVGKRLWRGMNDMEILVKITHGEIPSPATEKEGLDPKLVAICMKALEPDPDKRYQTASEMIEAMEAYIAAQPERATSREVGALVTELFAERRKEITDAIEKRVGEGDSGEVGWSDLEIPNAALSGPLFTPSHISGSLDALNGHSVDSTLPAGALSNADLGEGGRRTRGGRTIAFVAIGLLAAASGFAAIRMHERASVATTTPSASAVIAATTSSAVAEKPEVQLQIKLTPADATLAIDDKPFAPGSHFFRDGAVHKVRVSARHYEPEVRLVTFDAATVNLDFDLHKASEGAVGPTWHPAVGRPKHPEHEEPVASVAPVQPPPPVTVAPTPTPPPTASATSGKLGIDSSNPWK